MDFEVSTECQNVDRLQQFGLFQEEQNFEQDELHTCMPNIRIISDQLLRMPAHFIHRVQVRGTYSEPK